MKTFPPTQRTINALANELYSQGVDDGTAMYRVFKTIDPFDLVDMLRTLVIECPNCSFVADMKRLLKEQCVKDAEVIALDILQRD